MARLALASAVVILAIGVGTAAFAEEPLIFRWVDQAGNLHVTDRLGDVPEPYYSLYVAELKRREEQRQKQGQAPAAPVTPAPAPDSTAASGARGTAPRGPSLVDQEIQRRESWRREVAHWRSELSAATEALVAIEAERAQAGQNPLLVHTPQVKAALAAIEERRAAALARVAAAKLALLEELPQRARREHVPPKWLE